MAVATRAPHILRHLGSDEPTFPRRLADWDYRYSLGSVAPTLFEAFMALWQREVIGQLLKQFDAVTRLSAFSEPRTFH